MLARDREPRKAVHLRLHVRETAPREQSEDSQRAFVIRLVPGGEPYAVFAASRPL